MCDDWVKGIDWAILRTHLFLVISKPPKFPALSCVVCEPVPRVRALAVYDLHETHFHSCKYNSFLVLPLNTGEPSSVLAHIPSYDIAHSRDEDAK